MATAEEGSRNQVVRTNSEVEIHPAPKVTNTALARTQHMESAQLEASSLVKVRRFSTNPDLCSSNLNNTVNTLAHQ